MKPSLNSPCPCHSGAKYKRCCRPLHRGLAPELPQDLMRARYSAFAMGITRFVMDSTHLQGAAFESDQASWERSIREFAQATSFVGLEILESSADEAGAEASVTFRAILRQGARDVSFTERSRFLREAGRWKYHSGQVEPA